MDKITLDGHGDMIFDDINELNEKSFFNPKIPKEIVVKIKDIDILKNRVKYFEDEILKTKGSLFDITPMGLIPNIKHGDESEMYTRLFLIDDVEVNGFSIITPFGNHYLKTDDKWTVNNKLPTAPDTIAEFAARVCYRSDKDMFSNGHFLRSRLNEGHNDVIEHSWLSLVFVTSKPEKLALTFFYKNKYANISEPIETFAKTVIVVSANLRVWEDLVLNKNLFELMSKETATKFRNIMYNYSPKVFELLDHEETNMRKVVDNKIDFRSKSVLPITNKFGQKIALMSYMKSFIDPSSLEQQSATFFIEGISVPCATQITRHRKGSFSQESKRYVDLDKGEWNTVKPLSIVDNPIASEIADLSWNSAKSFYQSLREIGIRKEDARFYLPMATDTRIVMSMDLQGWKHFFDLRAADKAAQWEVRAMAQNQLSMLAEVFPLVFGDLWEEVKNNFKVLIV